MQRKSLENELKDKLEKLQNRKVADDNKLCIIDRYWTQLDEDLRIMLERCDTNLKDDTKDNIDFKESTSILEACSKIQHNLLTEQQNQPIRNFLAKLDDWDKIEIEENLKERVKFTTQTVAKLVANFERFLIFFITHNVVIVWVIN